MAAEECWRNAAKEEHMLLFSCAPEQNATETLCLP